MAHPRSIMSDSMAAVQDVLRFAIARSDDHGINLFRASLSDSSSNLWQEMLALQFGQAIYGKPTLQREFFDTVLWRATPERASVCLHAYYQPLTQKQRRAFFAMKADHGDDSLLLTLVRYAVEPKYASASQATALSMLQVAKQLDAIDFEAPRRYRVHKGFGMVNKTPLAAAIYHAREATADWLFANGAPLSGPAINELLSESTPLAWSVQFLERNGIDPHQLEPHFSSPGVSQDHVSGVRALLARQAAERALASCPRPA
jgi:hypothetical protein